jgi:hypothetical protein
MLGHNRYFTSVLTASAWLLISCELSLAASSEPRTIFDRKLSDGTHVWVDAKYEQDQVDTRPNAGGELPTSRMTGHQACSLFLQRLSEPKQLLWTKSFWYRNREDDGMKVMDAALMDGDLMVVYATPFGDGYASLHVINIVADLQQAGRYRLDSDREIEIPNAYLSWYLHTAALNRAVDSGKPFVHITYIGDGIHRGEMKVIDEPVPDHDKADLFSAKTSPHGTSTQPIYGEWRVEF